MEFSSRRHKQARKLAIFLCVIGCLCHLVVINIEYFQYESVATYAPYIALSQDMPMTSICFVPLTPNDRYSTFMQQKLPDIYHMNYTDIDVNVSSIMKSCRMRNFITGRTEHTNNCSNLFHATRSNRINYYICYTFTVKSKLSFNSVRAASMMEEKFVLYTMTLRNKLKIFNRMVFFNHFVLWPEDELHYLIDIESKFTHGQVASFVLQYELIEMFRLPPPYNTRCLMKKPSWCRENIIHSTCTRELCSQKFVITHIHRVMSDNNEIEITIKIGDTPPDFVKFTPRISTKNFFIQVCSILGLWCSLSVSSFIMNLYDLLKKSKKSSKIIKQLHQQLIISARAAGIDYSDIKCKSHETSLSIRECFIIFSKTLSKIIIILLFLREFTYLSIDYSKYSTRTEIFPDSDIPLDLPGLSYCFQLQDWMKWRYIDGRLSSFDRSMTERANISNLTLRQIFNSIPNVNSVIKSCRVRSHLTAPLTIHTDCLNHFNVIKFYHSDMICYNFNPVVSFALTLNLSRYNDAHPSILYTITIQDYLANLITIQPIVSNGIPDISRLLTGKLFRQQENELIISSFLMSKMSRLAAPYDTMCNPTSAGSECQIKCMSLSRYNLTPYSELHMNSLDYRLVNYNDMKNESFIQILSDIESKCSSICRGYCDLTVAKTFNLPGYSSNEKLELALAVPKYPFYRFDSKPVFTLNIFLYQLACCASFWLGLSGILLVNIIFPIKLITNESTSIRHLYHLINKIENVIRQRRRSMYIRIPSTFKKSRRNICRIVCLTLPVFGFIIHSFITIAEYFQYPTILDTRFELQFNSTRLRATICISLDQLDLKGNYSVRNIVSLVPTGEQILLECGHRGMHLSELAHLPHILIQRIMPFINSSSLCSTVFRVKRMISLAMICYEISPQEDIFGDSGIEKYYLDHMKMYQYFILHPSVAKFNLTIAVSSKSPVLSLLYSTSIYSLSNYSGSIWWWINNSMYRINSLPYPYDTAAFDGLSKVKCFRSCVGETTLSERNLLSSIGSFDEPPFILHESPEDSVSLRSSQITFKCRKLCSRKISTGIVSEYFKTQHDGPYYDLTGKTGHRTSCLWFRSSDSLIIHTYLHPALRFLDLVLYIGTLYSVWFSLSALQTVNVLFSHSNSPSLNNIHEDVIAKKLLALKILTQNENHRVNFISRRCNIYS